MNIPQTDVQDNRHSAVTVRRPGATPAAVVAVLLLLIASPHTPADCTCEPEPSWVIGANDICCLTEDCTVESLTILSGGKLYTGSHTITITSPHGLTIYRGGRLIVDGGEGVEGPGAVVLSAGGWTFLYGQIDLAVSKATLRVAGGRHAFFGKGKIVGNHDRARIEIRGGITFTSLVQIEGALELRAGDGTFVNNGRVEANRASRDDNRLTLYSGTFTGHGVYSVTTAGATLQCEPYIAADQLATDFVIDAGAFNVNENVITTGDLTFTGGTLSVAPGKTFQAGR